jgi:hypothetical protein
MRSVRAAMRRRLGAIAPIHLLQQGEKVRRALSRLRFYA